MNITKNSGKGAITFNIFGIANGFPAGELIDNLCQYVNGFTNPLTAKYI